MHRPDAWDQTEAEQGGFQKMQAGAYILKIVDAKESISQKGANMLVLKLDIAQGIHKDNYFTLSKKVNADCLLKYYRLTDGENLPRFKGDILAIEQSNAGFKFDFDERKLVGKLIGGNLRSEEYENKNGEIKQNLKVAYIFPVNELDKHAPLEPKKLTKTPKPVENDYPWDNQ